MVVGRCVGDRLKAIQTCQWADVSVIRLRLYRRDNGSMCQ